ncbi:MAG: ATP-binding protein [Actinomycetota bacterium]
MSERRFPFAAVVGQDDAKLALQLLAVDPGIGGVLLRGEKGSAKTTLARGLADLLPGAAPFVDLPLGATEDRLVGTIDVAALLTGGEASLSPGLLSAAHGGVLYVDEINLLADHLVDTLLDVSVSGINRIERDGVSHQHDARFVLVGSMNPEEGELRPQLLDRFGLSVQIVASVDPSDRAEAVRRRLRFDGIAVGEDGEERSDGAADFASADAEGDRLRAVIATARPAIVPPALTESAAELALAVGAEGLRADLVLCRAAAAHAALAGKPIADHDDLRRVAPLVLAHRSRRSPFDPPVLAPEALADAIDDALTDRDDERAQAPEPRHEDGGGPASGDAASGHAASNDVGSDDAVDDQRDGNGPVDQGGADPGSPESATGGPPPHASPMAVGDRLDPPDAGVAPRVRVRSEASGRRGVAEARAGRFVRDVDFDPGSGGPIAVVATVRQLADRRRVDPAVEPSPGDLRQAVRERPASSLLILVVDTSGSMGADRRARLATGTVLGLLGDAYERRDHVALVTFAGDSAKVALAPTGSVEVARNRLDALETGGPTPLAEGLQQALELARGRRDQGRRPFVVLTSDGRASGSPDALDRALTAAERIRRSDVAGLVLDCETGVPRLDLASRIAEAMGAACISATDLDPTTAAATIRTISQEVLDAR